MLLLPFYLHVLGSICITCSAVIPLGVMIGMSGESWGHKSTLSHFPSSQDWARQLFSLILKVLV